MKKQKKRGFVGIRLTEKTRDDLYFLAGQKEVSVSELVRGMIQQAVDYEAQKTGLARLAERMNALSRGGL